jgi:hypothetical protein
LNSLDGPRVRFPANAKDFFFKPFKGMSKRRDNLA